MRHPLRHRALSRLGRLGALAVLTVLLAGCFRYDATITVHEDGSGNVATILAVPDETLPTVVQNMGGNPFTQYTSATNLPPGVSATPYKEGTFTGMTVTIPFEAGNDISEQVQFAMGTGDERPLPTLAKEFMLRREGDRWHFRAHLIDASTLAGEDLASPEAKAALKDTSITLRLKLPGTLVRSNGDERRGGMSVWHIDVSAKGERTLEAVSMIPGIPRLPPVGLVWLFSLLGGAMLIVAGAAFQVWRMRD